MNGVSVCKHSDGPDSKIVLIPLFDMNVTSYRGTLRHIGTVIKSECLFAPETLGMTAKGGLEDTKKRGKHSRKFMPKTERWRDNTQTNVLYQQTEGIVEFMRRENCSSVDIYREWTDTLVKRIFGFFRLRKTRAQMVSGSDN